MFEEVEDRGSRLNIRVKIFLLLLPLLAEIETRFFTRS